MAIIYVDSAATGSNNGTSWTDAYTSIASTTGAAAGDFIYVDDGHSQTFGSTTQPDWTNATRTNPVKIFCVDKTDDSLSTGAAIIVSSGNLQARGHIRVHGMTFQSAGSVFINDLGDVQEYDESTFRVTGNTQIIFNGSNAGETTLRNCIYDTSTASGTNAKVGFNSRSKTRVRGGSYTTRAAGQTFAFGQALQGDLMEIVGLSIGNVTSIIEAGNVITGPIWIRRCSFGTFSNVLPSTPNNPFGYVALDSCSAGTISLPPLGVFHYENAFGYASHTLARYRTGGADDGLQANPFSLEMTTNANALELYNPLEITLGSNVIGPDVSISGATAQGIFTSYRAAPLATPAALTTDSGSTWTGTGVGTTQKIDHTLSNGDTLTVYVASGVTLENDEFWIEVSEPDQVGGLVTVKAFLAKPSTTVYVDPKIAVA